MIEPIRQEPPRRAVLDIRVGSATNALRPVSSAERSLAAGIEQWIALLLVAGTAILADQLTKWIVTSQLDVFGSADIVGPFAIRHVHNSGIAFGLFANSTTVVIALTGAAVVALLVWFSRSARRHPMLPVSLGLILGGSIANLIDRVRLGYVTDFLHIDHWPDFNLADTFIVAGVAILFLMLSGSDRPRRRRGVSPLSRT